MCRNGVGGNIAENDENTLSKFHRDLSLLRGRICQRLSLQNILDTNLCM